MAAKAIQIAWHRSESITSVDFCPVTSTDTNARFATAGLDDCIRIWQLAPPGERPEVQFRSTLAGHQGGVNIVRWAPDGLRIASGDNVGSIVIWIPTASAAESTRLLLAVEEDTSEYKEAWRVQRILTGHKDEVSDLAWSPCGKYLASVGTDQRLRVWDCSTGEIIGSAQHHTELVQGVAWDPLGVFIATQSVDRTMNLYKVTITPGNAARGQRGMIAGLKLVITSSRADPLTDPSPTATTDPTASPSVAPKSTVRLYADPLATGLSFFRRPSFSPDGSLLACPAAVIPTSTAAATPMYAVLLYARATWSSGHPVAALPVGATPAWCVRWAPGVSASSNRTINGTSGPFALPYGMRLAVGCDNALAVFDTRAAYPVLTARGLHVYRYQDVAVSPDGRHMCQHRFRAVPVT
ncbi:WD40-repeat-containing domain protein [Blastocladiella britannica]|nr:WD40-repeat-containing domain protein [Blastocladiella britannica]